MTTRRHIGAMVLMLAALAGAGNGWAQGASAAAMQLQLFEATKKSNELAAEQNKQTKLILEQTNALADASARQSAEAEQTRQAAEASMAQNQEALAYMKTLAERTLQAAQARTAFVEGIFMFWSAVLALFVMIAGYFNWREYKHMREKVARTVDDIRHLGLDELHRMLSDLQAEQQLLLDELARQKGALARNAAGS